MLGSTNCTLELWWDHHCPVVSTEGRHTESARVESPMETTPIAWSYELSSGASNPLNLPAHQSSQEPSLRVIPHSLASGALFPSFTELASLLAFETKPQSVALAGLELTV